MHSIIINTNISLLFMLQVFIVIHHTINTFSLFDIMAINYLDKTSKLCKTYNRVTIEINILQ